MSKASVYQTERIARTPNFLFQAITMRVRAACHDSGFQIVFREQPQRANDADRDVVRVGAADSHQHLASDRGDFPLPLPPGLEFATQQRIAGPKQE